MSFAGVVSLVRVVLGIIALKIEEAGPVSLVDRSSAIIISIVTQILFFDQIPNTNAIIGLILVTLAVLSQGVKKIMKKPFWKKPITPTN